MTEAPTREILFAWTAPGSHYPAYVNIGQLDGQISVIVRGPAEGIHCGHTTQVTLPPDASVEFSRLTAPAQAAVGDGEARAFVRKWMCDGNDEEMEEYFTGSCVEIWDDLRKLRFLQAPSLCLVCGATEPCMFEKDLKPDDPGVPCTFEAACITRAYENGKRDAASGERVTREQLYTTITAWISSVASARVNAGMTPSYVDSLTDAILAIFAGRAG